jgi:hypothetical protein
LTFLLTPYLYTFSLYENVMWIFGILRFKSIHLLFYTFIHIIHMYTRYFKWIFFNRFVMVVRKNILEYIIVLVVAKNKVRLKKCLKKNQIWQSSIVQINLSITSFKINTNKSIKKNAKVRVERSPIFIDRSFYNMEIFWEMVWSKMFNV